MLVSTSVVLPLTVILSDILPRDRGGASKTVGTARLALCVSPSDAVTLVCGIFHGSKSFIELNY